MLQSGDFSTKFAPWILRVIYIDIYINHLILTITNILRILYKYVLNDPRICLCLCACICKNKIDCLAKYISGQASVFCFWVKDKLGNCKMGEIYVQPQLQTNFVTLNFLFLFSIGFNSFVENFPCKSRTNMYCLLLVCPQLGIYTAPGGHWKKTKDPRKNIEHTRKMEKKIIS